MTSTTSVLDVTADRTLLGEGAGSRSTTPPPLLPQKVAALVADYRKKPKSDWWLLEQGDPFYERYEPFPDISDGKGPNICNFVRYFAQDGTELHGVDWKSVKPKRLSTFDLEHFRKTANEMLLGCDGTILVSAGTWGRRETPDGGFEYLPIEDYWKWRTEVMRSEPRTVANRPPWAESVDPTPAWGCVDYRVRRGTATFQQRLEKDGEMREGWGSISGSFTSADQLRTIARDAIELADLLDDPPRLLRRSPEVDEHLRDIDA